MRAFLFILFSFLITAAQAAEEPALVTVVFDKTLGKLEFRAPAELVTGLKKTAISDLQKKMQNEAFEKMSSNIEKIVVFPANLGCVFSKDHLETTENPLMVDGSWNLQCQKSPMGSKVRLHFHKFFPRLRKIEAVALTDGKQKSVFINQDGGTL